MNIHIRCNVETDWVILHLWMAALCIERGDMRWFMSGMVLLATCMVVLNGVQSWMQRRKERGRG